MSSDYCFIKIDGYTNINGIQVPYCDGDWPPGPRYLDWNDIRGEEARQLTSPYGSLDFAVGTGDDFHCFDWARLPDGRMILHATINSETGSFIQDADYEVVWPEEAVDVAAGMVDQAEEWLYTGGDKPLRHTQRGWNQDPFYFVRSVARAVGDPRIAWWKGARICKPRIRSAWTWKHPLPHNPEILRLHDPEAIILRFGEYDSEPIAWMPDDKVYDLALNYMKRYGWDINPPGK